MMNPFAILGIAPTLDSTAVRRAYFAGLKLHPPHADPDGFRRLRSAYEALTAPGGLALAVASTPIDPAERSAWAARWEERCAVAARRFVAAEVAERAVRIFTETVSSLSLSGAAARFGPGA